MRSPRSVNIAIRIQIENEITKGIAWLSERQNTDGGFGNSPSTVYDSALAVMALREFNVSSQITNNGLNYLLAQQSDNGSWHESPYQTALAINAVWKATIDPDLSVTTGDITFIPDVIKKSAYDGCHKCKAMEHGKDRCIPGKGSAL